MIKFDLAIFILFSILTIFGKDSNSFLKNFGKIFMTSILFFFDYG